MVDFAPPHARAVNAAGDGPVCLHRIALELLAFVVVQRAEQPRPKPLREVAEQMERAAARLAGQNCHDISRVFALVAQALRTSMAERAVEVGRV